MIQHVLMLSTATHLLYEEFNGPFAQLIP